VHRFGTNGQNHSGYSNTLPSHR